MPPASHSSNRGQGGAPSASLPTELWQEIAGRVSTHEWVRTCGSVCRALRDLQPRHIDVYVGPGDAGLEALRWTAWHWQQAITLDLHLGYYREQDINTDWIGDLRQTLEGAPEAAAAQSVTVSVDPQTYMISEGNSNHVAAYLERSLRCCWKGIKDLDIYAHYMVTIPPLHNLGTLHLILMADFQFEGLLASVRSLAQLQQLHLSYVSSSMGDGLMKTMQLETFDVGCLSHLDTLVLDRIVPEAAELPSTLRVIQLTGGADTIENATWLNAQVPLRALCLTSESPLSDNLLSLLHDMRHSLERFELEINCEIWDEPVQSICMGCALEDASMLPAFRALKTIRICTDGNVSIVIPAESAIEELWLRADVVDIGIEHWSSFAARMQSVTFFSNQNTGAGFRDLQTLHTSRDLMVREHAWCCQSFFFTTTTHLFSARRIVEGADELEESSDSEGSSEVEGADEECTEDMCSSKDSEAW